MSKQNGAKTVTVGDEGVSIADTGEDKPEFDFSNVSWGDQQKLQKIQRAVQRGQRNAEKIERKIQRLEAELDELGDVDVMDPERVRLEDEIDQLDEQLEPFIDEALKLNGEMMAYFAQITVYLPTEWVKTSMRDEDLDWSDPATFQHLRVDKIAALSGAVADAQQADQKN